MSRESRVESGEWRGGGFRVFKDFRDFNGVKDFRDFKGVKEFRGGVKNPNRNAQL